MINLGGMFYYTAMKLEGFNTRRSNIIQRNTRAWCLEAFNAHFYVIKNVMDGLIVVDVIALFYLVTYFEFSTALRSDHRNVNFQFSSMQYTVNMAFANVLC